MLSLYNNLFTKYLVVNCKTKEMW